MMHADYEEQASSPRVDAPTDTLSGFASRLARRSPTYGVGGLLLFTYGLFTNVVHGPVTWDHNWFLLVAHRLLSGDVLYRDVWFVATPLSMYVTAALAAVFGTEVLVIKALMALLFALTVLLTWRIARQLDLSRLATWLLVGILLVYYPSWMPGYNVPYTPMGYMFLLATLSAVLDWRACPLGRAPAWRSPLLIAGICAGLGFVSKQNLGVYALAALCLSVLAVDLGTWVSAPRLGAAAVAIASTCLTAGLILLPVLLTGSGTKLLDYGFLSQGTYVGHAQITYTSQLATWLDLASDAVSLRSLGSFFWQSQFVLPFLAFAGLLWAWAREDGGQRRLAAILLLFVGAAFVGVFPRVDINHMVCAVPTLLLGLAWATSHVRLLTNPRWGSLARTVLLVATGLWLTYHAFGSVRWMASGLRSGRYQFAPWPRFRGVFLRSDFVADTDVQAQVLRDSVRGDDTFILSLPAAFYYHVTGLRNPTPFDFPLSTAFGLHGQEEVIEAIEQGQVCWVCVSPLGTHAFAPVRLERFVLAHMEQVRETGWCTLYYNPQCPTE
jgi:4-amino-4-deoxy-L-arabinose transferase-like glycosyltransferase